jgi:hypothetical protein
MSSGHGNPRPDLRRRRPGAGPRVGVLGGRRRARPDRRVLLHGRPEAEDDAVCSEGAISTCLAGACGMHTSNHPLAARQMKKRWQ